MSKVIVVLILVAAVAVGASTGLALKPAAKPPRAAQPQPKPQQAAGSCPACPLPPGATMAQVYTGCVPTGPGVPPALAGLCWVGAGGSLIGSGAAQRMQANLIFPNVPGPQTPLPQPPPPASPWPAWLGPLPNYSGWFVWFLPPVKPGDPVYYTFEIH